MSVVGIVPAAGAGERLGADVPKAFAVLGGRPMVEWSLDVLREVCDRVVVAVPPDRVEPPDFVAGGATRSESVRNALAGRAGGLDRRGPRRRAAAGDGRARAPLPRRARGLSTA